MTKFTVDEEILVFGLSHHFESVAPWLSSHFVGLFAEPLWNIVFDLIELHDLVLQKGDVRADFVINFMRFRSRAVAKGLKQLLVHSRPHC